MEYEGAEYVMKLCRKWPFYKLGGLVGHLEQGNIKQVLKLFNNIKVNDLELLQVEFWEDTKLSKELLKSIQRFVHKVSDNALFSGLVMTMNQFSKLLHIGNGLEKVWFMKGTIIDPDTPLKINPISKFKIEQIFLTTKHINNAQMDNIVQGLSENGSLRESLQEVYHSKPHDNLTNIDDIFISHGFDVDRIALY